MEIWVAIQQRLKQLCIENDMSIHELAERSRLPPSTVDSILNGKSQNPGLVTMQSVCDGLNISMKSFFDDPLFDKSDDISK